MPYAVLLCAVVAVVLFAAALYGVKKADYFHRRNPDPTRYTYWELLITLGGSFGAASAGLSVFLAWMNATTTLLFIVSFVSMAVCSVNWVHHRYHNGTSNS